MRLKRGDHVCSIYSTRSELAAEVAAFLADGLHKGEQCWYVASGDEAESIAAALRTLQVDVGSHTERGSLKLLSAEDAYVVRGHFDPEMTIKVFNDAIDRAYKEGFTGFRAAAEMSWALSRDDRLPLLIEYEVLLRTLFASCRAIGLCLYDAQRMPLSVINGALATHPLVRSGGEYGANSLYGSKAASRAAES